MDSRFFFLDVEKYLEENSFLNNTEIPADISSREPTSLVVENPSINYKSISYCDTDLEKLVRNEPFKVFYELEHDRTRLQLSHFTPELCAYIIENKISINRTKVFKKRHIHSKPYSFTNQQDLSRFILKEHCDYVIPTRISRLVSKPRKVSKKFSETKNCFLLPAPAKETDIAAHNVYQTFRMFGYDDKIAVRLSRIEHDHLVKYFTSDEIEQLASRCGNTTLFLLNNYVNALKDMGFSPQQMIAVCSNRSYGSSNITALLRKSAFLLEKGLDHQTIALIASFRDGETSLSKTIALLEQLQNGKLQTLTLHDIKSCILKLINGERQRAYPLWADSLSTLLNNGFNIEQVMEVACSYQGSECLEALIHYHRSILDLHFTPQQIVTIAKKQQRSVIFEFMKDYYHVLEEMNLSQDELIEKCSHKYFRDEIIEVTSNRRCIPT